jgi:hypothetical protein
MVKLTRAVLVQREAEAVRHGDAATAVAAEAPASAVDEQSAVQVILYEQQQPPSPASQSIIAHAFPHPGVVPWPHSYSLSATRRRASIRSAFNTVIHRTFLTLSSSASVHSRGFQLQAEHIVCEQSHTALFSSGEGGGRECQWCPGQDIAT